MSACIDCGAAIETRRNRCTTCGEDPVRERWAVRALQLNVAGAPVLALVLWQRGGSLAEAMPGLAGLALVAGLSLLLIGAMDRVA